MSGALPGLFLDVHLVEEIKRRNPAACTINEHPVVGIAFHKADFTSDHPVECADIADNIDPFDVDTRGPSWTS